jgi:hypothetical protein
MKKPSSVTAMVTRGVLDAPLSNRVTVVEQPTPLRRECWTFWFWPERLVLVLDGYECQERQTPRHKWRSAASYWRLRRTAEQSVQFAQVPWHADIHELALDVFRNRISIQKEMGR